MLSEEGNTNMNSGSTVTGAGGLKEKRGFSWVRALMVLVLVSLVGGFLVWGSFATSANAAWVNQEYQTLLGRPADSSGLAFWTARIDKDPAQKSALTATIKATTEYKNYQATKDDANWTLVINNIFATYLKRTPNADELSAWLSRLKGGSWTTDQFIKQISESDEAKRKAGDPATTTPQPTKSNTGSTDCRVDTDKPSNSAVSDPFNNWSNIHYVQHLFRTYTGRDPEASDSGVVYWLKALDTCQKTRTEVQSAISNSSEAKAYAAKQAEIQETVVKPLKNAYMVLLQAALAKEGQFTARNGERYNYANCTAYMTTYKPGSGEMIYDFCFLGVGLARPELDYWVHQVTVTKFLTVDEAIAAINSNAAFACNSPFGSMMPSCQGGGKYAPTSEATSQTGSVGGGGSSTGGSSNTGSNTTSGSNSTSTGQTGGSTGTTNAKIETVGKSALQTALQSAQPISEPDQKIKVCSDSTSASTCVVIPVGEGSITPTKPQPTEKIPELYNVGKASCNESTALTLCSSYTQNWSSSQTADGTTAGAEDASSCTTSTHEVGNKDQPLCDKALEAYLSTTGYLKVDEKTSQSIEAAKIGLENYQKDHDLTQSADTVTQATWKSLKETASKVQQAKKAMVTDQEVVIQASNIEQRSTFAILFPKCENKPVLGSSSNGDCVKRVQQTLALIARPDLVINGTYDSSTQKAVSDYQSSHNVKATGKVDSQTWKLLEAAKSSPTYKSPFSPVSGSLDNKR